MYRDLTMPLKIDPSAFYDREFLISASTLDLSDKVVDDALRSGALRCVRKGRIRLFKGEWIINWLSDERQEVARAE